MIGLAHLTVSVVLVVAGVWLSFGVGPALVVAGLISFGVWMMQDVD